MKHCNIVKKKCKNCVLRAYVELLGSQAQVKYQHLKMQGYFRVVNLIGALLNTGMHIFICDITHVKYHLFNLYCTWKRQSDFG